LPLWHWFAAVQVSPFTRFTTHVEVWQKYPEAHVASEEQLAGHAPAEPLHTYGVHEGVPAPVTFVHVPSAGAPSAAVHTSQPPVQAALQHTPSVQYPVTHSVPAEQPVPVGSFGTQLPVTQR
jgi:hypothetical protein